MLPPSYLHVRDLPPPSARMFLLRFRLDLALQHTAVKTCFEDVGGLRSEGIQPSLRCFTSKCRKRLFEDSAHYRRSSPAVSNKSPGGRECIPRPPRSPHTRSTRSWSLRLTQRVPSGPTPFLTANGEEGADPTTGTSRRAAILLCSSQACRVYRDGLFSVPHSKTGALLGDGPLRRLDE